MKSSALETKLEEIVRPAVEELGFALCRVSVTGGDRGQTVQVMAENPETRRLGIDDCTTISHAVSALLDVEDPISGSYTLEVSSPGIDRLLCRPEDYRDFCGFEAKVELDAAIDGQRRYRGTIKGIEDDNIIVLQGEAGEEFRLPVDDVRKAKLILTDALINATSEQTTPPREER